MQSSYLRPVPLLGFFALLASCSAVTEFDRSRIGASDGGEDATLDGSLDASPDASEDCLGVDCSAFNNDCVVGVCRGGSCFADPRPSGTTCDDGKACTENDACDGNGTCTGQTRSCDDGLTCTDDSCDEVAGCQNEIVTGSCLIDGSCFADEEANPDNDCQWCAAEIEAEAWSNRTLGTSCDDGLFCTEIDQCDGKGNCEGTERDCSDDNLCNIDGCDDTADECTHLTSTDNCNIDSMCVARGVANPDNSCQVCDPDTSLSEWTNLAQGETCSDGDACTLGDQCNDTGSCVPGTSKDCNDTLSCTSDSCNPANGQCLNELSNTKCLIGGVCYNDNQGRAGFPCQRCEANTPLQWTNRPVDTDCEDGDACTESDKCNSSGTCVGGAPPDCDDGNQCTINGCNSGTGCTTQDRAMGFGCNDGDLCTTADQCDGSGSCGGTDVTCTQDGNDCTVHTCDASDGACKPQNEPNTKDCDDGNMCTTGNKCDGAGSCDSGAAVTCSQDANDCTVHACDPGDGACKPQNEPDTKDCDDGDLCTTGDKCDGSGSCGGTDVTCTQDGNDCTVHACDTSDGACKPQNEPDTKDCDDGDLCTTGNKCDGAGACDAGTAVDCSGASGECQQMTCNANTGTCNVDNGTACGSSMMCMDGSCV